ncbi:hypothetical protein [Thermophilibacter provencensis]|uniref:hypothetical protein n=1 Tax=Thermophilibacter provencensis TaxID=1852386 RepID=UPI0029427CCA|nr:hypothetical protein [Thermophilibacter provencensis]
MANQLRAALYALVRNYRTWVALALVVLGKAYAAWSVTQGVTYGLQDSLFRDKALLLVVLFAGAGVAAFDQRGGALRSACCTERGRTGYVASRFVAVAALALGLLAAAVALDVVVGALVPGASVIAASPAMGPRCAWSPACSRTSRSRRSASPQGSSRGGGAPSPRRGLWSWHTSRSA